MNMYIKYNNYNYFTSTKDVLKISKVYTSYKSIYFRNVYLVEYLS